MKPPAASDFPSPRSQQGRKVAWNAETIQKSLLDAEKSLLNKLMQLENQQTRKVSLEEREIPNELAKQLRHFQGDFNGILERRSKKMCISFMDLWKSGGMESWAVDIRLAALDNDGSGLLDDDTVKDYLAMGENIVKACEDFATNNGVVGALMISVLLPVTIQFFIDYDDIFADETTLRALEAHPNASDVLQALALDGRYGGWESVDVSFYLSAVAFGLFNVATILAIVLVGSSARIYTQISFWMPNLESKVWYAQLIAPTLQSLETTKTGLLALTVAAMICLAFAKALWMGLVTAVPALMACGTAMRNEYKTSVKCTKQMLDQTRMVLPQARADALVQRAKKSTESKQLPKQQAAGSIPGSTSFTAFSLQA